MARENGFENKRVVIVGGSSGFGLAVAEEVASQGSEVVIVSSNAERVQASSFNPSEERHRTSVDVSDEGAVESFFKNLGAFDHLVFTAGDSPARARACSHEYLEAGRRAFELRYWSALSPRLQIRMESADRKGGSVVPHN